MSFFAVAAGEVEHAANGTASKAISAELFSIGSEFIGYLFEFLDHLGLCDFCRFTLGRWNGEN